MRLWATRYRLSTGLTKTSPGGSRDLSSTSMGGYVLGRSPHFLSEEVIAIRLTDPGRTTMPRLFWILWELDGWDGGVRPLEIRELRVHPGAAVDRRRNPNDPAATSIGQTG